MSILTDLIEQDQKLEGHGRWFYGSVNSSLVVDAEKDIFFWNSKEISGNAYTWLTKIKNYSHQEALSYLKQFGSYTDTFIYNIKNHEEVVTYPAIVDIMFERGQHTDQGYWKRRGLSDDTISRFRLGFLDTEDSYGFWTIPIYEGGLFRQVQLRRDRPDKVIRKYYRNTLSPSYLFNSDILNIVSSVIITESPVSCMRVMQEGHAAVSHDGGSSYWSGAWYSKFMFMKSIIINYDNDDAGRKGAIKVVKQLGEFRCKVYNFEGFEEHFGADNFLNEGNSIEAYRKLLNDNAKYIFEL
jgi:hypothetical protein